MKYTDQKNLILELKKLMLENGVTQTRIAEQLGMSRQVFSRMLMKKNFSFEDMQKILSEFGYELHFEFKEKEKL